MPETEETVEVRGKSAPLASEPELASMAGVLRVIRREKKFIGVVMIAITIAALIVALLMKNSYTAVTTLMPPQQNRSIASALLSQLGAASALVTGETGVKDPNDLFIAILQSRTIADALIAQQNLQSVYRVKRPEDLRKALAGKTHIKSDKGGVIIVAVDDSSPTRAAALANSYVTELYRLNSHIAVTEAGQRRTFFENQYREAQQELLAAEEQFKSTQQNTGIMQLDAQAKAVIEQISALQLKLEAKEVQVQAMRSYATDQNPNLKLAEQEEAALREELAKADRHQPSERLDIPISQLPSAAMAYAMKLRDLKYKEAEVEALGKQLEIARIDEAKEAPLIQVIDPAVPPTEPSGPNRIAIVVAAIISGFVLGTGWSIFREHSSAWIPRQSIDSHRW